MTNLIRAAVPCAEYPYAEHGKRDLVLGRKRDCERVLMAPTIISGKNMGTIKPEGCIPPTTKAESLKIVTWRNVLIRYQ